MSDTVLKNARSLRPLSPRLSRSLSDKMSEPESPKGPENVKTITLHQCKGRSFMTATWQQKNSCCDLKIIWRIRCFRNTANIHSWKTADLVDGVCSLVILKNAIHVTPITHPKALGWVVLCCQRKCKAFKLKSYMQTIQVNSCGVPKSCICISNPTCTFFKCISHNCKPFQCLFYTKTFQVSFLI